MLWVSIGFKVLSSSIPIYSIPSFANKYPNKFALLPTSITLLGLYFFTFSNIASYHSLLVVPSDNI